MQRWGHMTSLLVSWSVRPERGHKAVQTDRETQVPVLPLAEAALGQRWVLLLFSQGRINPASTTSAECARCDGPWLYKGCFNRPACVSHTCQSQGSLAPKPAPSLCLPHPCSLRGYKPRKIKETAWQHGRRISLLLPGVTAAFLMASPRTCIF